MTRARAIAGALVLLLAATAASVIVRALLVTSPQVRAVPAQTPQVDAARVAAHLAQAIRYPTVSYDRRAVDAAAFHNFAQFLEASYPAVHQRLTREVVSDFSLLYTWQGQDASLSPVLFAAHMDVVPVDPATEKNWTHPPFEGAIADGYVWGRGALDDKISVIGIMEAVELLAATGIEPKRTVYLAFGHDEEVFGRHGAARIAELLRSRSVKLEFALDEGGGVTTGIVPFVSKPVAVVSVAEKGFLNLELVVYGEGGHAGSPPPHTAAGTLATAIHNLERHPMPASIRPPQSESIKYLVPEMSFGPRVALANLWLFQPLIIRMLARSPVTNATTRTTTAVTMLEGSPKSNVLPAQARAVVNIRLLPGDRIQSVVEHVRSAINDSSVKVNIMEGQEAGAVSDIASPAGLALQRTIREVYPEVVVAPMLMTGASDVRHYQPIAGNAYRFVPMSGGPDDIHRMHGIDERVPAAELEKTVRFYARLIRAAAMN